MQMNLDGVGVCGGQNTTLAAECFMWRDGYIEYPATRTSPIQYIAWREGEENKIQIPIGEILAVKYHREKKIGIQMRCVYFCVAFEEESGVVSLKRGKGPIRYIPPPTSSSSFSLFSLPPFPSRLLSLRPTPTHSPRTHIFNYSARWRWGATQKLD
ncbi:hypothetical protein ATANTOWER_032770 [Ataeniobius toweri]|uniref:Uncharacterized protein n=1 Tax=Ataeniobius toweri TaxID=208326 RepID=A0ABU7A105_9TELE|nr:hypothetical protein [Ataeniobius toweri]